MAHKIPVVVLLGFLGTLGGCFDDDDDPNNPDNGGGPPVTQNAAPTITGAPPASVLEGELYDFTPNAVDADGDSLTYSISRKPAWASFNPQTGRLWGTPDSADVGNFTNIGISVSDGTAVASLTNFDVSVNPIAIGSATLSWMPPTQNDDGSTLTDLAGYRIYFGRDQNNLSQVVVLHNPGLTRYVIENLSQARWYFSMSSVNMLGTESDRSAVMSKTIS